VCASYQVCNTEVHGQGDDGRHETGPEGACEVGDIADEPDGQEDQGDAVCGAGLVVLDQLGDLRLSVIRLAMSRVGSQAGQTHQQEYPGAEADGAPDAAESLARGQVVGGSHGRSREHHGGVSVVFTGSARTTSTVEKFAVAYR
jgi:hypothetical protein